VGESVRTFLKFRRLIATWALVPLVAATFVTSVAMPATAVEIAPTPTPSVVAATPQPTPSVVASSTPTPTQTPTATPTPTPTPTPVVTNAPANAPAPTPTPSSVPFVGSSPIQYSAPTPSLFSSTQDPATASISGRVVDAAGNPIEGVSVSAISTSGANGWAQTDADGSYTISGLMAGSYSLSLNKWGSYPPQYYGGTSSPQGAKVLTVAAGGTLTDQIVTMLACPSVSGRVVDAAGKPIAGVRVWANVADSTVTDVDGTYTVKFLYSASGWLQFSKDGFVTQYYGGASSASFARVLKVPLGTAVTGINVTLLRSASISGHVADAAGSPLEGVFVSAIPYPCCSLGSLNYSYTEDDGSYQIDQLPPGSYALYFSKSQSSFLSQYLGGTPTLLGATVLTVGSGSKLTVGTTTLVTSASISGRVVDSAGNPIEGASVTARGSGQSFIHAASTAEDGSYTIDGLAAGSYTLEFSKSGSSFLTQYLGGTSSSQGATVLTVALGDSLTHKDMTLPTAASISGRVVDEAGNPIEGVSVAASSTTSGSGNARTAADGTYKVDGLVAGSYTLQFSKPGSYPTQYFGGTSSSQKATVLTVASGDALRLTDMTLLTVALISGRVVDAAGNPIAGVSVSANSTSGGYGSAQTAADGTYKVDGLAAGSYTLQFSKWRSSYVSRYLGGTSSAQGATVLTVAAGDALANKDMTLPTGASISGTVRDSSGKPLAGATIQAESLADGWAVSHATSGADGTYTVAGLEAGEYLVSFSEKSSTPEYWDDKTWATAESITVTLGQKVVGIDSMLTVGASIAGVVRDAQGAPIQGVYVVAVGPTRSSAQTGPDGAYVLSGLPAGSYKVSYRAGVTNSALATQWWQGKWQQSVADSISVTSGQAVTGKNIVMVAGATLSGIIRGAGGAPISGATVSLDQRSPLFPNQVGYVTTSANGSYTITGLSPGTYYMRVNNLGSQIVTIGSTAKSVTQDATLDGGGGSISGIVTSASTATPLSVSVGAYTADGTLVGSTQSDPQGKYVLSNLPVGNIYLYFSTHIKFFDRCGGGAADGGYPSGNAWFGGAGSLASSTAIVSSPGSNVTNANIALKNGRSVSGKVRDSSGKAVAGVLVMLWQQVGVNWVMGDFTTSEADGAYTFANVLGTHRIMASEGGTSFCDATGLDGSGVGRYQESFYGGSSLASSADVVVTDSADRSGIDIMMTQAVALNELSAGAPTIGGAALTGQTLTAMPGTWTAGAVMSYQWRRDGVPILGAVAPTYVVKGTDLGSQLTVAVTGSLTGYATKTVFSPATSQVLGVFTTMPVPTITGTPQVWKKLTAVAGVWAPVADSFTYVWMRDGVIIAGATSSSYELTVADLGKAITVEATAVKAGYQSAVKSSNPTNAVVGVPLTAAPVPTITGTPQVGKTLTAAAGSWLPATVSLSYQWKRDGVVIAGATNASYVLTAADLGKTITVDVTGSKTGYASTVKTSDATTVVLSGVFTTMPVPTITGVAQVGKTLTAVAGVWAPVADSVSYVWKRDGVVISGATNASYVLTAADLGKTITVDATGSKTGYASTVKTSDATTVVLSGVFTTMPVPTITGVAQVGKTLTAVAGVWAPVADSVSYVWKRGGLVIEGATSSTYVLTAADAGKTITVETTAVKAGYVSVTKASSATAIVAN
jgi:protocatechuate 3,4-dioxygenase beta subunit